MLIASSGWLAFFGTILLPKDLRKCYGIQTLRLIQIKHLTVHVEEENKQQASVSRSENE